MLGNSQRLFGKRKVCFRITKYFKNENTSFTKSIKFN